MRDYKQNLPHPILLLRMSKPNYDLSKLLYFRSSILPIDTVGKKVFIHNGRASHFLFVKPEHLNQPIGTFVFTKLNGYSIHVEKNKKSKKIKS